jgi:hypothetical protein
MVGHDHPVIEVILFRVEVKQCLGDHVGNVDIFPEATLLIQKAEFEHYVGPNGEPLLKGPTNEPALLTFRLT